MILRRAPRMHPDDLREMIRLRRALRVKNTAMRMSIKELQQAARDRGGRIEMRLEETR
mgnify:CR=1 FL=1